MQLSFVSDVDNFSVTLKLVASFFKSIKYVLVKVYRESGRNMGGTQILKKIKVQYFSFIT